MSLRSILEVFLVLRFKSTPNGTALLGFVDVGWRATGALTASDAGPTAVDTKLVGLHALTRSFVNVELKNSIALSQGSNSTCAL